MRNIRRRINTCGMNWWRISRSKNILKVKEWRTIGKIVDVVLVESESREGIENKE